MTSETIIPDLKQTKDIPFHLIIKELYNVDVKPFDIRDQDNLKILQKINMAAEETIRRVSNEPIKRPRPNEVGNDIEPFVMDSLNKNGLCAEKPTTTTGHKKSTGYPDIKIKSGDKIIYLEVKTYAAKNKDTTQRSFYLSPAEDPKVTDDGHHLLIGFEIKKVDGTPDKYVPVAFKIVDLYDLKCDIKLEVNSDNYRLYSCTTLLKK